MAGNRLKSPKKDPKKEEPSPAQLLPEKDVKVPVKELVRDERTQKIIGIALLLAGVFLFIAFTSYLFTWKEDQDEIFRSGLAILKPNDLHIANLLGSLGAYISHVFIYKGFGLASYLFCSTFWVIGANLLFGHKIFSIARNLKYLLVGLFFLSTALGFFFSSWSFPYGGGVGTLVSDWLEGFLGKLGTTILILVGGFVYVIWRFNPVFKLPARKPRVPKEAPASDAAPSPVAAPAANAAAAPEDDGAKLFIAGKKGKKNTLKGDAPMIVVPEEEAEEEPEFILVEKEDDDDSDDDDDDEDDIEEEEFEEEVEAGLPPAAPPPPAPSSPPPPRGIHRPVPPPSDLTLEIKPSADDIPEEPVTTGKPIETLDAYDPVLDLRDYQYPSLDLLDNHGSEKIVQDPRELETNKEQIINTLKNYDISIQRIAATVGPTVTLYEIVPAAGVRISRIKNLEDDIALSLAALGIRIIAPIPGKGTIGIEVPNVKKTVVGMKGLLSSEKFQNNSFALPIAIGKKIDNENFIVDLASMPHLLMAGATGQGKSVGLNAILVSLLYKKHPSQLKFVLVDPKKVELSIYRTIERHFLAKLPGEEEAIITDTKKVIHTLNALCIEMDNRYDLLKEAGCRNLREYNEKFSKRRLNPEKGHQYLPFIVLVVDEFADLIMTAGKEVEMPIARLAQLARAVGIHLIIATQRPSVNIITGTIKANFPARIAFKVSSKIDSRTILDAGGAEQLIGRGDMLISFNGEIVRLQCAFVDTPEVEKVTDFIGEQRGYPEAFRLPEYVDEKDEEGRNFDIGDRDQYFDEAARLIVQSQQGSTSLIQRKMKLGYNRAGRLMDQLEAAGIVGPSQGSKPREVLMKTMMELEDYLQQ
ncbi:DNA translocase FtsK [Dinghuibacter silviterrae]|uniref:S-DNA-T family DNA segregation ATPase FtsK/SpoIIIE n=1 Tax=Dinghuibacter silviterrae TaxID=1539049 RepID=A0A4R8DS70_9BACT|nr:DNA translocase FtsK [Dinghuibacter silviterrae]TDX00706.1 S-DNA-T family DNA segregation ATPase FtsK/SpoIIIE [Dinghuibacter silviterrae]